MTMASIRARRVHLLYMMCISWQWPLWAIWMLTLPAMVYTGHWYGALSPSVGVGLYLLPTLTWLGVSAALASLETRHTYAEPLTARTFLARFSRVIPNAVISTGMLPHQFSAFCEGLFGPMHSEFERTPKGASVAQQQAPPGAAGSKRAAGRRSPAVRARAGGERPARAA